MFSLAVLSALYAVGQATTFQTNTSDPIIDLGYASYRGTLNTSTGIKTFFGLRYAAPPVGELRWRPPLNNEEIAYISKGETIDGTKPGPICVQGNPAWRKQARESTKTVLMSEDCLLLDVSVPLNPSEKLLPVMVQIHGGGYVTGDSGFYPGEALITHSKNSLIYVSIQYRLGPYGFLSSQAVKGDGSANVALLDQRAALTWVQNHISQFGGNADRVTILGGSAGGGSVTAQMMLYGGAPGIEKPPFSAAIAEYPWWQPFHADDILEAQYQQLLQAAGCLDLPCLRNTTENVLAAAAQETYSLGYRHSPRPLYGYGDFYWGPSVDGEIIRGLPSREFQRGSFSSVPLLTNRATFEGYSFSNQSEITLEEEVNDLQNLFPNANDQFFTRLFELYPRSEFNSTFWQRQTLFGDFIINCPTQWISDAVGLLGKQSFKLIFNAGSRRHGATKPFVFDPAYGSSLADNVTVSQIMKDWYVSFALHQDPNKESFSGRIPLNPPWPPYGSSAALRSVVEVNVADIGVGADPDMNVRCSFWQSVSDITRN